MKPLRILSWNVFLMPNVAQPETAHGLRAQQIAYTLAKLRDNYEIIALQKTFHDARRKTLVDELRAWYPHVIEPTASASFLSVFGGLNSGITIFSKTPLTGLLRYDWEAAAGFEANCNKGFMLLQGTWEGQPFQLAVCHLQGHIQDTRKEERVRYAQIYELRAALDRFREGSVTQIVCGDFAMGAGSAPYTTLRTLLGFDDPGVTPGLWSTSSTTRAPFPTMADKNFKTELSDFVFLRNSSPVELAQVQRAVLTDTSGNWQTRDAALEPLSYKIPVTASVTLQLTKDKPIPDPPSTTDVVQTGYLTFYQEKVQRTYNSFEYYPQSTCGAAYGLAELKRISRLCYEQGQAVRAMGSGHSFSAVARAGHSMKGSVLVDIGGGLADVVREKPTGINFVSVLSNTDPRFNPTWMSANLKAPNRLVEIGAGTTIRELNQILEAQGLGLINMGTYNGQTFAGASSTSTHGSGIFLPPFPDLIRSLVLVSLDESGQPRAYRIEPSSGPTNRSTWKVGAIDELIQDDDVFYSAICAMGSFGFLHSFVLEVQPFYYLEETSTLTTWSAIKQGGMTALKAAVIAERHFELVSAPYRELEVTPDLARFKNEVPVLMVRRNISTNHTPSGIKRNLHFAIFEFVGDILGGGEVARYKRAYESDYRTDVPGWPVGVGGEAYPFKIAGLDSPVPYRDRYFDVFRQGGHVVGGYAIELVAPLDQAIAVMDRILAVCEANRARGWKHSGMIGVRFVAASKAYLSQFYGKPSVTFEVTMLRGTPNGFEALRAVQDAFKDDLAIRLHWGLTMVREAELRSGHPDAHTLDHWRARYPKFDVWLANYQRFNRHRVYANRHTEWMGLDLPTQLPTQSCPLRITAHLVGLGDRVTTQDELAGTTGQSRAIEGFQIDLVGGIANLGLRYMAHLADLGDSAVVPGGTYLGTRNKNLRVEGFMIELTGAAAAEWQVYYQAHLGGTGDTPWFCGGQFCGTRGEWRAVEAMRVLVRKRR